MKHLKISISLALGLAAGNAFAGGNLDEFYITDQPANDYGVPGFITEVTPIFWDERCASVEYTLDTIPPNATNSGPEIDLNIVRDEIQTAMDQWTQIPTSYIEMNITDVRTIGNGPRGFDFINEVTFETAPGFFALASSPSTALQQDAQFTAGLDIDGDGDSDVYDPSIEGLNVCADIDGDGDIEFPAGFYAAGTILDNDVQYGQGVIWEVNSSNSSAADIQAITVHEFGHSHGLSHSLLNKVSDSDGSGSTMFPFIDTRDALSEQATRSLHTDDIAWSSLSYPEGGDGPLSSLQPGDIAFDSAYSVLTGSVERFGEGILGGNVYAQNKATGEIAVGAFSGEATFFFFPPQNQIFFRANPADTFASGNYRLPLPRGEYEVFLQSPDVGGASGSNISLIGNFGDFFGQHGFDEEGISTGNQESAFEDSPGAEQTRVVRPGKSTKTASFEVNQSIQLQTYGDIDFGGTGAVIGQNDVKYATRFSNAELMLALDAGAVPTTALFQMTAFQSSSVANIERISFTLGRLNEDGTIASIDLDSPLREMTDFAAQDGDLSPFYFKGARGLGQSLANQLRNDPTLDVFVVIEAPNGVTTTNGAPAPLLAIDVEGPFGESFLSVNGGDFQVTTTRNWAIELLLSP